MKRRDFLRMFGIGGVVAGTGGAVYAMSPSSPKKPPKPDNAVLALHSGEVSCRLTSGEDGYLWIKVNNEWKRVVVE